MQPALQLSTTTQHYNSALQLNLFSLLVTNLAEGIGSPVSAIAITTT